MRTSVLAAVSMVAALAAVPLAQTRDNRLIDAIKKDDLPGARAFLSQGVDVNARSGDGGTALHWAVYRENQEAADLLIRAGAAVNNANDLGVTPLWVAASNASAAMVGTLMRAGANPNLAPATGGTPLMLASRNGDVSSVKALLGQGADVNAKEEANGQTALMWALGQQHSEIAGILLDAGADIRARTLSSQRVVLLCCPTWAGDPEGTVTI